MYCQIICKILKTNKCTVLFIYDPAKVIFCVDRIDNSCQIFK